jgi:ribose transport system substrate-binding protein
MKSTRTQRKLRLSVTAALSASILALAGCGQIYPSTEPATGPANGIKSNIHDVVVGFAQQQLQAPYLAAM